MSSPHDKHDFLLPALILSAAQLSLAAATATIRPEHIGANVLLVALSAFPRTAVYAKLLLPVWIAGVILDNQRLWISLRGEINTGSLWELEHALFPAPGGMTWPDWFAAHNSTLGDVVAGGAYATYLIHFLAVATYFLFVDKARSGRMASGLMVATSIATVIYLVYPAAPPWYVAWHGMGPADPSPAGGIPAGIMAAGAARFDELFGITLFHEFYGRNPNAFGAMPSLHVAYPTVAFLLTWSRGKAWRLPMGAYALIMGFSAVYLSHHYVLDVIAGMAVAGLSAFVVTRTFTRSEATVPAPALRTEVRA